MLFSVSLWLISGLLPWESFLPLFKTFIVPFDVIFLVFEDSLAEATLGYSEKVLKELLMCENKEESEEGFFPRTY